MKEIRFSIQWTASNRKTLVTHHCSQCTTNQINAEHKTRTYQQHCCSHNNRSLSSVPINFGIKSRSLTHRASIDRTYNSDKFDTLLMLAARRTTLSNARYRQQCHLSTSSKRKSLPLLFVEQDTSNQVLNSHPQHAEFLTSSGTA